MRQEGNKAQYKPKNNQQTPSYKTTNIIACVEQIYSLGVKAKQIMINCAESRAGMINI